uniref:Protein tyrosine phosphatase non-receptor type 20 n=1 Tax=Strix occidentalis caurina TaxID=311401 RepID=A0A8D0FLF0_STROC
MSYIKNSGGHTILNHCQTILWQLKEMVEICFRSTTEIATFCFCTDDKTRVPLGEENGYINASYIRMKVGEEEHFYIITQWPLPSTMADFWQMVWESESDVIAMMTKEVELGQVKWHQYWPEPPHDSTDLTEEKRIISHLQFTTWPDHNTPKLAEQLLKFICYMRKAHSTGPIVAHCSTGIGRSGVLLCVEVLLSYIEKDLCVSIKQIIIKYYKLVWMSTTRGGILDQNNSYFHTGKDKMWLTQFRTNIWWESKYFSICFGIFIFRIK